MSLSTDGKLIICDHAGCMESLAIEDTIPILLTIRKNMWTADRLRSGFVSHWCPDHPPHGPSGDAP